MFFLNEFHLFHVIVFWQFSYFSMGRAMFLLPKAVILTGKKSLQKPSVQNVSLFPQTIHFIFCIHLEQQVCPR